jgi:hypothetical protein
MLKKAKEPFQFYAASYLVKICHERADNLRELADGIRRVSDNSIAYHAIQCLESHHYTSFSSDFSQWVLHACNEEILAERLGVIDVRDFSSIPDLRDSLARIIEQHLEEYPAAGDREAFETFYFCELSETTEPLGKQATDLRELADGIQHLSLQALHYHLISSYMRPPHKTNDFSSWIQQQFEQPELARALNRIDFYTNTLEGVRSEILKMLRPWTPS